MATQRRIRAASPGHLLERSSVHASITPTGGLDRAHGKLVAYYRVSTATQGRSGLGLEAQQQAVRMYLNSGRWTLVAEYTEVESGKLNSRPQLLRALADCR